MLLRQLLLLLRDVVFTLANRAVVGVEVSIAIAIVHMTVALCATPALITIVIIIAVAATLLRAPVVADLNDATVGRDRIADPTPRCVRCPASEDDIADRSGARAGSRRTR